jgi:hypothetical protein
MATDTNLLRGDKSVFRGKRPFSWKFGGFRPAKTEQAITPRKAAKSSNPNVVPIRLHLAASYVRAGRMEDAQCEVEEIRTISPDETLDLVKTIPIADKHALQGLLGELREGGLPE